MPDGPALALGLGARVSARKSIRFELKIPKRHVRVSGQPASSVYVREATRVASYSLLWARHLGPARQVHVEWLAGLTGMMFSSKGNSVLRLRSADGSIRQFNDEIDDGEHSMAFTAGIDGVFPVTRRIEVLAQLRTDWAGLGALVRGGMTLRMHF